MKIAIEIDPKLLESVMEASGEKTESGAVNAALEEHARRKKIVDGYSKDEALMRANERRRAFLDSLWDDPR